MRQTSDVSRPTNKGRLAFLRGHIAGGASCKSERSEAAVAKPIIPWADWVKKTSKLTIALDESLGKQGWAKAFKDAIAKFNELSTQTWKLGVTFEITDKPITANVVAQAKAGDFDFEYKDAYYELPKTAMKFDGNSVHGLTEMLYGDVKNRVTKADEKRIVKAFTFVPAKPHIKDGKSRLVGEPVKLVIAFHEMIHACGLNNDHHTVDDVFCWPRAKFDTNNPADDRVEAYTGQRKDQIIAGKTISVPVMISLPPVFLNTPTQDKIRKLWAL
jgi:hypothetical protein